MYEDDNTFETIEHESGLLRVRVVYDHEAECPLEWSDDVEATVIESSYTSGGWTWDTNDQTVIEARERFAYYVHHGKYATPRDYGKVVRMLERYFRVFHNSTIVVQDSAGMAPSDWATIAYVTEGVGSSERPYVEAIATEHDQWRSGEAYGIIVERRSSEERDDDTAWLERDAVWGFIGDDYALAQARRILAWEARRSPLQLALEV